MTEETPSPESLPPSRPPRLSRIRFDLTRFGLREPVLRLLSHAAVLAVVALGVWAARLGLDRLPLGETVGADALAEAAEAESLTDVQFEVADLPAYGGPIADAGIVRIADAHTILPERPRMEIVRYVVQPGDTIFGIAEAFGLRPESVLWGNYDILQDNPHALRPGQELEVPPVDGTIYAWHEGDGLNGVASFFGVAPEDIVDWPGNNLEPDIDVANPSIPAGTLIVVPGGYREFVTWSAPRITRSNPGVARILGPGACGMVYDGPVGTGTFIFPTPSHYLSGYDYNPGANHPAIDLAGDTGHPIYASDNGVIVYAGWNDWGYGLVIVVDHGNGWQTLYAHLSQINVVCGQAVYQGNVIGLMGCTGNCTGPHLHFEMLNETYGKVNPWDFLQ
jgi:murein DD-endopeptidase MepM/ murein hydrolase activator NlpD